MDDNQVQVLWVYIKSPKYPSHTNAINISMTDIFISYSRKDKPWVKTLAASLEAEGYVIWWDPEILPGQDYENVIKIALDSAKCVLTVWSKNSITSTWVKAESNKGLARNVYVPVLYEPVEPPMQFGHIQSADLINWKGKTSDQRYRQLLRAIAHTLKESPPSPPPPPPIKWKWKWIVGSIALVSLASGGYMTYKPSQLIEAPILIEQNKPQNPAPIVINTFETDKEIKAKENLLAEKKAIAVQLAAEKLANEEAEKKAREKQLETERISRKKEKAAKEKAKQVAEQKAKAETQAKKKAEEARQAELAKTVPLMVSIPPDSSYSDAFDMGCVSGKDCYDSEKPVHTVKVPAFLMSKYEVTFKQWDQCVKGGGCSNKADDEGWGREDRPVINVSWNDTQEYVAWLSKKTGEKYRLPTEAEWEYAARGGTKTKYSWGNEKPSCDPKAKNGASHDGGEDSDCYYNPNDKLRGTEKVGSYNPNSWGLYDMHGNVWEWVQDCYHQTYNGAPDDGSAWETNCYKSSNGSLSRVLRGGSWYDEPRYMRSANRFWFYPSSWFNSYGFRVARTP